MKPLQERITELETIAIDQKALQIQTKQDITCPMCLGSKRVQGDPHEYDIKTGHPISFNQNKSCNLCEGVGCLKKEPTPVYERVLVKWEK